MSKLSKASQVGNNPVMFELPQLWLPERLRQRREDERLLRGRCGITRAWLPMDPCCCGPCDYITLIRSYGDQEIHWEGGGGVSVSAPSHTSNDSRCTEGSMDFSILAGSEDQTLSALGSFSGYDMARCGHTPYECQSDWYIGWTITCDEEAETWRLSANAHHSAVYCYDSPCDNLIYLYYAGETPIDLTLEDDGKVTGSYTVELTPDGYYCPEDCSHICGDETVTFAVEFNP